MAADALRGLALVVTLVVAVVVLALTAHTGWAILVGLVGSVVVIPTLAVASYPKA